MTDEQKIRIEVDVDRALARLAVLREVARVLDAPMMRALHMQYRIRQIARRRKRRRAK